MKELLVPVIIIGIFQNKVLLSVNNVLILNALNVIQQIQVFALNV